MKSSIGNFRKVMKISRSGRNGIDILQDYIIIAGTTIAEHSARLNNLSSVIHKSGLKIYLNTCIRVKMSNV